MPLSSDATFGGTGAAAPQRFFLGFFVTPSGERLFDRVRLEAAADGGWRGDVLRLVSGRSEPERHLLTGRSRGDGFELELVSEDDGVRQRLAVAAETPDIEAGYLGVLEGLDDTPAPLPGCPYVLEEAPAVRLDRSPTHGWGTVAVRDIARGAPVLVIRGPFSDVQTPYSFRSGDERHVEPTGYGHFVNHACEPSCEIVYREDARPELIACRDLAAGSEITFDYTATEGDLANSFACRCPATTHKV